MCGIHASFPLQPLGPDKAFLGSVIYQQRIESPKKGSVGTWGELSFAQVSPTKIAQAVPELGLVLGAVNPD